MTTLRRVLGGLRRRQKRFAAARELAARRAAAAAALARFDRPYRLNVGCGKVHFPGWVNLDGDAGYARPDVLWDLRHGLPVPDGTCRLIYSEHVIEHIPVADGVAHLAACRAALVPGGVLRVATPSLDNILDKAVNGDWRDQDWLRWPGHEFIQSRAEMLNVAFRWWEHQWLYDRHELRRRLHEAGFATVRDVEWGTSDEPDLRDRETRKDSLLICEAVR